jgi:hypothetical protein
LSFSYIFSFKSAVDAIAGAPDHYGMGSVLPWFRW